MGRELGTCHNIDPEELETNVGVEEDLREVKVAQKLNAQKKNHHKYSLVC